MPTNNRPDFGSSEKKTYSSPQLVELGDPFAAVDTRVDELINHMHKGHNSGEK